MLNLTPHAIVVNTVDGNSVTFPPSGIVARVSTVEVVTGDYAGIIPVVARSFGEVTGLPEDLTVACLVSGMVLSAVPGRPNTFAPDSGETAIRNEKGHIVAVTRLVAA